MNITIKVAAIITNSKKEILLLQEQYHESEGLKWNIVKGTFDNGNETLIQCVEREIAEEANISVENIKLYRIFQYGDKNNVKILFVFTANVVKKYENNLSIKNQKSDEKITQAQWFSKEQLLNFAKDDFIALYTQESIISFLQDDIRDVSIKKLT